jgi:hypothetical protein
MQSWTGLRILFAAVVGLAVAVTSPAEASTTTATSNSVVTTAPPAPPVVTTLVTHPTVIATSKPVTHPTVIATTKPGPPPPADPAPAPPPPPAVDSTYGCGPALSWLRAHAAPGFRLVCPGYAMGHQAMTCQNMAGVCPGARLIVIADPCAAAYKNEAYNSWIIAGLATGRYDPYGFCSR